MSYTFKCTQNTNSDRETKSTLSEYGLGKYSVR